MENKNSKRRENGFLKGTFVGTMVSACIFAVMLALVVGIIRNEKPAAMVSQGTQDNVLENETVLDKIGTLQRMIEKYSLNEADETELIDGMYKGLVSSLGDVYSGYFTKDEFAEMMEATSGEYKGIGVIIQQDYNTGVISIVKVFKGGPAEQAGVKAGDVVYKVNGKEVTGEDSNEVVAWIKNSENDEVTLEVARSGESDYISMNMKLSNVEVPTVESKMLADQIGYIAVSEFDEVTAAQFKKAVDTLKEQGMKGLVIDLRDNPGGLYTTVVEMLDYILPEGLIVYTEDKNGEGDKQYSDEEHKLDIPYAVIINGNSASASEIFAGAVKDFGIGKVVGTKSYGKGIVQQFFPLSDGSALKLTVSKYFTPSGVNIHGTGIQPDIEVALSEEAKAQTVLKEEEDNQLQAAIEAVK